MIIQSVVWALIFSFAVLGWGAAIIFDSMIFSKGKSASSEADDDTTRRSREMGLPIPARVKHWQRTP